MLFRSMREQIRVKQIEWDKQLLKMRVIQEKAVELAKMILIKDRRETIDNDKNRSWYACTPEQMVDKAKNSFDFYCKDRTSLMQHIMDLAEERREQNESLREQLTLIINQKENAKEVIDEYNEDKKKREVLEKTDKVIKQAATNGTVHMFIF